MCSVCFSLSLPHSISCTHSPHTHIHDGIEIVVVAAHHIAAVHHDVVVAAVLVGLLLLLLLLLQVQVDLLVVPAVVASTLAQTLQSFAIVVLCTEGAGRKFGQMAAIKSLGMANLTWLVAGAAAGAVAVGHWGIISILCMLHVVLAASTNIYFFLLLLYIAEAATTMRSACNALSSVQI